MHGVLRCLISAAIGGTLAFWPAFSMTNSVFATSSTYPLSAGSPLTDPSGTTSSDPVATGQTRLVLGLPASESSREPDLRGSAPPEALQPPEDVGGELPAGQEVGVSPPRSEGDARRGVGATGSSTEGLVGGGGCSERILIPSLGINNCIQNQAASDLSTPSRQSGKVANISVGGARFIYGHNSQNIFAALGQVQNGALVQVITKHGTENYQVNLASSRKSFDYRCLTASNVNRLAGIAAYRAAYCPELISMSTLVYGAPSTLSLMTCAGSYDSNLGTYDRRHVIIAQKL